MADLGPWLITARNAAHAEYLMRSRAEQRGLHVTSVAAAEGSNDMWVVTMEIEESAEVGRAAQLGDETQVFHLDTHRPQPPG